MDIHVCRGPLLPGGRDRYLGARDLSEQTIPQTDNSYRHISDSSLGAKGRWGDRKRKNRRKISAVKWKI